MGDYDGKHDSADVPTKQANHDGEQKRLCKPLCAGGRLQRNRNVPLCAEKQSCGNQGAADMAKFQRNFRHSLCV